MVTAGVTVYTPLIHSHSLMHLVNTMGQAVTSSSQINISYSDDEGCNSDLSLDKSRSFIHTPDNQDDSCFENSHSRHDLLQESQHLHTENPPSQIEVPADIPETFIEIESAYQLNDGQLCTGEMIDSTIPGNRNKNIKEGEIINGNDENTPSCSDRRRQFSMTHSEENMNFHSLDSLSSELSTQSRHSVSSFLQARECDAEEILMEFGFGGDSRMYVPDRFLFSASSTQGVGSDWFRTTMDESEDDIFESGSMSYSFASSWSDRSSLMEHVPDRFIRSVSSLGSFADSEENKPDKQRSSSVPDIVEPDQNDEDSFDLMRHLRLNRVTERVRRSGGVFLEPVTEELEVSSVGSGSARTKISAQQDSLDSLGNVSVLTKISRHQDSEEAPLKDNLETEVPDRENPHLGVAGNDSIGYKSAGTENSTVPNTDSDKGQGFPSQEQNDSNTSLDKSGKNIQTSSGDSESGISSAFDQESLSANVPVIRLPVFRTLAHAAQDSFELEEIVTSEENLDQIVEKGATRVRVFQKNDDARCTKQFRRENSDESSGFEDDVIVILKKKSRENLSFSIDSVEMKSENDNAVSLDTKDLPTNAGHLMVPFECSTPKTEPAESRRSAFGKRHSWSSTKHRKVGFEDDPTSLRSRSFDDRKIPSAHKLDTKRHSLDIPLLKFTKSVSESREDLFPKVVELNDTSDRSHKRTTPDKNTISNIKTFISSLLSIRHRFKKPVKQEPTAAGPSFSSTTSQQFAANSDTSPHTTSGQTAKQPQVSVFVSSLDNSEQQQQDAVAQDDELISEGIRDRCYEELFEFKEGLHEYRAGFIAMEVFSTMQENYYTQKLLGRFAWDTVIIRRLRTLIKAELDIMQSCLAKRETATTGIPDVLLPCNVLDQMKCLLRMQSSLGEHLVALAAALPCTQQRDRSSLVLHRSCELQLVREDMENKNKSSLFEELSQIFIGQIDELRKDLKEKDKVIAELRMNMERNADSNHITS